MKFRIDLKIFLFIILFYFTRQIQTYSMLMIFAIIHELGHLLAGLIVGMKPEKMELNPFGFSINFKINPDEYNKKIKKANMLEIKKILVSIAGPVTNGIIILITMYLKINIFEKLMIIYSNLLLVFFNILPIYPLDGGRILRGIIYIFGGEYKAEKCIHIISLITITVLTVFSSVAILYFKNIAIFFAAIYLWIITINVN